jgi:hypothetical protein
MQWWVNYNHLSEKQSYYLDRLANHSSNKVSWLKGFAGTGKTLLLAHLLERLSSLYPSASICYLTFTNSLVELVKSAPIFYSKKQNIPIMTNSAFIQQKKTYDFVLLDEIQDLELEKLNKIKQYSKKLFIAGDFNQQIYQHGISHTDLLKTLQVEEFELNEIYRLTRNIYNITSSVNPQAKIVEGSSFRNTNSNPNIKLIQATSEEFEHTWVWNEAFRNAKPGHPSVILLPNSKHIYNFSLIVSSLSNLAPPPKPKMQYNRKLNYADFNNYWKSNNIGLMYLGNSFGDLSCSDFSQMVYLMTYHSSKGLDFKNVFIPNLTYNLRISPSDKFDFDRNLLFVAITRSRQNLFLSHNGNLPHHLIKQIPSQHYDSLYIDKNYIDKYYNSNDDEGDFF